MNERQFSIITPSLNCEAKIGRTIESVLSQDPDLFDYLVVDGGSADRTVDVVRGYGVARVIASPDRGVFDAMNKGIAETTGRYLYFLGAGDVLRPGVLKTVAEALPRDDLAVAYGSVLFVRSGRIGEGRMSIGDLTIRNLCHQSAFYSRPLFDRLGTFDLRYHIAADWLFNLLCFTEPGVVVKYLDVLIGDYEGGGQSDLHPDEALNRDWPLIVRRRVPFPAYVKYSVYRLRCAAHELRTGFARLVSRSTPPSG